MIAFKIKTYGGNVQHFTADAKVCESFVRELLDADVCDFVSRTE